MPSANLDIMLLNILCIVIHQYVLHLSTIPCFFTLKWCSSGLLQCHLSFPIIHAYVALVFFCMYSASIQFYIQLVVFLLCCPVVSLAITPYSLRPDYMLPKMDKKDVSRTEIRLDPSIFFWMEGIHVNMSCLSILQYLFHLSVVACFIIKAPFFYTRHARGRRLC